jgi:hypothetical protein
MQLRAFMGGAQHGGEVDRPRRRCEKSGPRSLQGQGHPQGRGKQGNGSHKSEFRSGASCRARFRIVDMASRPQESDAARQQ